MAPYEKECLAGISEEALQENGRAVSMVPGLSGSEVFSAHYGVKETSRPYNGPVKNTLHGQRFHPNHISVCRLPNDCFDDAPKDEAFLRISVGLGASRTHTDEAEQAMMLHRLDDVGRAFRIDRNRFAAERDT
jgi:hypothetical protein